MVYNYFKVLKKIARGENIDNCNDNSFNSKLENLLNNILVFILSLESI